MDRGSIEPRRVMWAVAEVSWEDQLGTPYRSLATLEYHSPSGACIRVKTPIQVGCILTVKWQWEEFSGIARSCRSDGSDYVLGIQRVRATNPLPTGALPKTDKAPPQVASELADLWWKEPDGTLHQDRAIVESKSSVETRLRISAPVAAGYGLNVAWHGQQFAGVVQYCRREGAVHVVTMQHEVTNSRIQPAPPEVSVIPNPVVRWPAEEMPRPLLSDAVPVERTTISNKAAPAIHASNLAAVSAVGHARNRGTHRHAEDRVSSSFNTVRRPPPHGRAQSGKERYAIERDG